jgi:hypothetical protein
MRRKKNKLHNLFLIQYVIRFSYKYAMISYDNMSIISVSFHLFQVFVNTYPLKGYGGLVKYK